MNLSELRYVVALARERHFGRAAAACFASQPCGGVSMAGNVATAQSNRRRTKCHS